MKHYTPRPWIPHFSGQEWAVSHQRDGAYSRLFQTSRTSKVAENDIRLAAISPDLYEACQIISPARLRLLADWFDKKYDGSGEDNPEVQNDLRNLADAIEKALAKVEGKEPK